MAEVLAAVDAVKKPDSMYVSRGRMELEFVRASGELPAAESGIPGIQASCDYEGDEEPVCLVERYLLDEVEPCLSGPYPAGEGASMTDPCPELRQIINIRPSRSVTGRSLPAKENKTQPTGGRRSMPGIPMSMTPGYQMGAAGWTAHLTRETGRIFRAENRARRKECKLFRQKTGDKERVRRR